MSRLRPLLTPRVILPALAGLILIVLAILLGPMALRGPRVVQMTPADASAGANPQAAIRIEFDQWVRPETVAAAVALDPPVPLTLVDAGTFSRVVTLQPEGGLRYGADYRLTIGDGAQNLLGRALETPVTVAFATVPYNSVATVGPPDAAEEVALNAPLTVAFAAPVVAAETIAAAAEDPALAEGLPQPLVLDPPASGVGRWLTPSLYSFAPEGGLHAATRYTATIDAAISPDGQARLEQPLRWSFRTEAPLLTGVRPFDGAADVAPAAPIEVRLAPDVDVASASQSFTLTSADGAAASGSVEVQFSSFLFTPAAPLERNARYVASLAPGVRSRTGATLNAEPLTWSFTVMGDLEVVEVIPPPDTFEVLTATNQISVRFNHPVVAVTSPADQAALPQPLTITPALPGVGRWLDTSTYVYSPTGGLAPATSYRVEVAAGLADQTGGALRQPYAWNFATITPQVVSATPAFDEPFASPTDPLRVVFNQPMDPASLQGAIALEQIGGGLIPGSVSADGAVATFTPAAPLERGASYALTVNRGARAAQGNATLADGVVIGFRVAPPPALIGSTPASGAVVDSYASLTLRFSTPMDWASVEQTLTITPQPTQVYTGTSGGELYLYVALTPETDYRISVGAAARDPYGATIGQPAEISFRTAPLPPSFRLVGAYQLGAYNAYVPTRVPISHVNTPAVAYRLYRIDPAQAVRLAGDYEAWRTFAPDQAALVAENSLELSGERNIEQLAAIDLGQLSAGTYYLDVRGAGDAFDRQILAVSPYALTIKRSADRVFVWAADLATGRPVADLDLTVGAMVFDYGADGMYQGDMVIRELGRTDAEGVLHTDLRSRNPYDPIFLWSAAGERFAFGTSNWSSGISPWDFNLPANYSLSPIAGNLATDRPIYRPGQDVAIRGVLRLDADGRYSLPGPDQRAHLTVNDPQNNTIISTTLDLTEFGAFNTRLTLDPGAAVGGYSMIARLADGSPEHSIYGQFTVAEYRKPVFEIAVTPTRPELLQGEPLEVNIAARYFAGGALANAPVRWRLLAAPFTFTPESAAGYSFETIADAWEWYRRFDTPRPAGGELLADGTATTDAQGRLRLSLPADAYSGGNLSTRSRRLTLDVEITDIDGQVIAAQGAATLHAGAFYAGLRPEGYVAQVGQPQAISLITLDPQGQTVGGQALEVSIFRREWFSVREQGADGRLYWTSNYTDTLVETQPATSDAQGRAQVSFTPAEGGSYRITAEGRDAAGRTVSADAFTWAYGGAVFWGVDDSNRVDLIADKDRYQPGDTARILVTAPYPDMTALLTIERGKVIEHRLFTLQGTTELIEAPISADYAPNVYLSVVLIKPAGGDLPVPDMRVGLVNLPVSTEQQELNISITPDTEQAGPRDEVTYTIRATDYRGQGVRAEVALALVDKAILTLADDPNPTLRQSFYEKRPLGVFTAQSLTALVDRVTLRLQPGGKGGGGGEAGDFFVRRDFPDTAYWNPALITGDDGLASVTVTLPDSLTTWRMTARGLTTDTRVGLASQEIIATRPLMVRPALPRFLTVGDAWTLQAVVQNTTADPIDATVTIALAGTAEISLDAPAEQRVSVPANGTALVRWQATTASAGATTVRLSVSGGGLQDAMEQTLPVQRYQTPEVVASAGQVRDQTVETLPPVAPGTAEGDVTLELAPSLAAGVASGLDYLTTFPYACTEQTVSRFLPNAVTYRLFTQMGMDDPALKANLEQNLTAGLQRLAALQHLDGGWGWWSDDASHPYISAYVVQGLVEARKAGYGVDETMLANGIAYLKAFLEEDWQADPMRDGAFVTPAALRNTRAYILFVLAEAGQPDRGRTVALYTERAQLAIYGRAYLLMAFERLGPLDQRGQTLLGELLTSARVRPTDAHWQERSTDYWTMNSDTRTTAIALQALVRTAPDSFLTPNAVRHLMSLRDNGHWSTTQESALTLMALSEYIAQSGELAGDYSYRAALDGRTLREGAVNRANLNEPVNIVFALADLKANEASQLTIQRQAGAGQSGAGRLYYTLRMRTYQDAATVTPLDQGLGIQRDYIAVDSATLTPTGQIISAAQQGDVVQVRLTITVPSDMYYLTIEDMLPAGLEPIDTSLKTASAAAIDPTLAEATQPGWWYFGQTAIRDNRVAVFAAYLPQGRYTYTYLARAATVGAFQTLPATAYQMYAPEVFGRSAGASFAVTAP